MDAGGRRPLPVWGAAYWTLLLGVLITDLLTKAWAVRALVPRHVPHPVLGDLVRFTLSYNPGAAFGMSVGPASRWFFGVLAVAIIVLLLRVTRELVRVSWLGSVGLPLVLGGAIGNLIDRVRSELGVVDFIDIGVGAVRFWTFNIADMGVSIGAACLVIALWRLDAAEVRA
jgi:signal peptidase II